MRNKIVNQAVSEWMSAYMKAHLKGFKGEGLEQEQDWCHWLKDHAPEKFQAYLLGTGRLSTSVQTLRRWWEAWIEDHFIRRSLVEEWRADDSGKNNT